MWRYGKSHTHTHIHPTSSDKCIHLINPFDYHMNCLETSTNTWLCRVLLYVYVFHTQSHTWCVHLPMCARKIYSTVVMCLSFVVLSLLPCKCVPYIWHFVIYVCFSTPWAILFAYIYFHFQQGSTSLFSLSPLARSLRLFCISQNR